MKNQMVKVKLYTASGEFVAEANSIPFVSWPQAFYWGQRIFVRENFRALAHETAEPPSYYEATPLVVWTDSQVEAMANASEPKSKLADLLPDNKREAWQARIKEFKEREDE